MVDVEFDDDDGGTVEVCVYLYGDFLWEYGEGKWGVVGKWSGGIWKHGNN